MASDKPVSQESEKELLPVPEGSSVHTTSNGHINRSSLEVPQAKTAEFLRPGTMSLHGDEMRKTLKAGMSGVLALGLWLLLGGTIIAHLTTIIVFSWHLIASPVTNDVEGQKERIDKATSNVSDTAKTLYTLLTPLATAITGYYFTTGKDFRSSGDAE